VPTPNPSSLAIERQEAPDAPRPSIWDSRYFLPAIDRAGLRHFRIHDSGTPLHRSCYRPGLAWHKFVISSGTALSRSLWTFEGTSSQARTLRGLIGSTRRQVSNKMQRPRNWMKWMSRKHRWKCLIIMVAPGRVELPTFGLGNRCSIHLSYGAACWNSMILHCYCVFRSAVEAESRAQVEHKSVSSATMARTEAAVSRTSTERLIQATGTE
jgi:hypothetical protein